jgi:Sulfotransferase domain
LIKLGISPIYHMREVSKNNHVELWIQALEAKFGKEGVPWTTKGDFDRILGHYEVSTLKTSG